MLYKNLVLFLIIWDEEKAATRFAGAFLMPRFHLEKKVGKHRHSLGEVSGTLRLLKFFPSF